MSKVGGPLPTTHPMHRQIANSKKSIKKYTGRNLHYNISVKKGLLQIHFVRIVELFPAISGQIKH